jgi:hypothetical protein
MVVRAVVSVLRLVSLPAHHMKLFSDRVVVGRRRLLPEPKQSFLGAIFASNAASCPNWDLRGCVLMPDDLEALVCWREDRRTIAASDWIQQEKMHESGSISCLPYTRRANDSTLPSKDADTCEQRTGKYSRNKGRHNSRRWQDNAGNNGRMRTWTTHARAASRTHGWKLILAG